MNREMVSFTQEIDKLDNALKASKDVQILAIKIQNKGFFSALGDGISGKTSKEIAGAVRDLGASVEVTQKIISLSLKVSHIKNEKLKDYSLALKDKITRLDKETETCNLNLKGAKKATLIIVMQLKTQIDEKLKQEQEIAFLKKKSTEKDVLDDKQSKEILVLKEKNNHKNILDSQQTNEIKKMKNEISNLKRPKLIFSSINFILILIIFYLIIMKL
jgi:hypothetical protein